MRNKLFLQIRTAPRILCPNVYVRQPTNADFTTLNLLVFDISLEKTDLKSCQSTVVQWRIQDFVKGERRRREVRGAGCAVKGQVWRECPSPTAEGSGHCRVLCPSPEFFFNFCFKIGPLCSKFFAFRQKGSIEQCSPINTLLLQLYLLTVADPGFVRFSRTLLPYVSQNRSLQC